MQVTLLSVKKNKNKLFTMKELQTEGEVLS